VRFFRLRAWKKINKLFTGLGSVRIVKNCDLGLENATRGRRPRAAFSIYMLFAGREVRIGKNCARDLGRAQDLGHRFSQYGPT